MIDPEKLVNEWTWKTSAMRDMTLAVCRLAIMGGEFSAMDLAGHGAESHGGTGIAGSVFGSLAKAEIIEPAGSFGQELRVDFVVSVVHGRVRFRPGPQPVSSGPVRPLSWQTWVFPAS